MKLRRKERKMEENKKDIDNKKDMDNKKETSEDVKKEDVNLEKLNQQLSFLQSENAKLKEETKSWQNKYYEAYANLANTRKSLEKDHQQFIKYCSAGFIEKLIPSLDAFEMAFKAEIKDPVVNNFAMGFKMIFNQIEQALQEQGVSFISPKKGDKFDEKNMHAIQTEIAPDEVENNSVCACLARGYLLHDRMIRPAMVSVYKKEEKVEKAEEKSADKKDDKEDKTSSK